MTTQNEYSIRYPLTSIGRYFTTRRLFTAAAAILAVAGGIRGLREINPPDPKRCRLEWGREVFADSDGRDLRHPIHRDRALLVTANPTGNGDEVLYLRRGTKLRVVDEDRDISTTPP